MKYTIVLSSIFLLHLTWIQKMLMCPNIYSNLLSKQLFIHTFRVYNLNFFHAEKLQAKSSDTSSAPKKSLFASNWVPIELSGSLCLCVKQINAKRVKCGDMR